MFIGQQFKKESLTALKVYLTVLLCVIGLLFYVILRDNLSALDVFKQSFTNSSFLLAVHVLFVLVYLLFLIGRYFIRVYRKKGFSIMSKRLFLRVILPSLIVFGSIKFLVHHNSSETYDYVWDYSIENTSGRSNDLYSKDKKLRGMTVFNWRNKNDSEYGELVKNNIEWVAIVPFFYQENEYAIDMRVPENDKRWSRRDSTFISSISKLQSRNIHVMLKPHLWLGDGWRSNVTLNSQAEWTTWFNNYRKGILHYAKLAAEHDIELFCIGTELKSSLKAQPEQWKLLLSDIKALYKGKLTYAANWDGEYELIDFWEELDYIGIQAYFPLTTSKNPALNTIKDGWKTHISTLESLSQKHNRPILFTEIGYKNDATATIKPWEWGNFFSILFTQKSNKTQQLAYEALYSKLWKKEWFVGTFIWQWDSSVSKIDFTPQNKPAQNTIAKWYGQLSEY